MLISNKNAWVRCWIWWWGVIGVFVSIRSISKQITKGLVFFFFFLLKIGSYSNLEEINLCRCSWSKSGNFWKDSLYLLQDIVGHNWTFHIISSQKHQVRRQELSSLIMVIHVCFTQHETYIYDHVDLQQRTLYFKSLNIRKYRCLKRTAGDHTHFSAHLSAEDLLQWVQPPEHLRVSIRKQRVGQRGGGRGGQTRWEVGRRTAKHGRTDPHPSSQFDRLALPHHQQQRWDFVRQRRAGCQISFIYSCSSEDDDEDYYYFIYHQHNVP